MASELLWAGRMWGTNTGNVFLQLDTAGEGKVTGLLRVNDEGVGIAVWDVTGTFTDGKLDLQGTPKAPPEGAPAVTLKASGALTGEGTIQGTWETTLGTGGTFILHPHNTPKSAQKPNDLPERVHTVTRQMGAIRLYPDDFRALVETLQQDFEAKPIVSYREGGVRLR